MSYQAPPPPPQQPWQVPTAAPAAPSFAPAAAPPGGGRRTGLLSAGLGLLAIGIAAIIAGILVANSRYEDGVKKLARAPAGCTTTLEFDKAGTYTLYIETKGKISDRGGDCGGSGSYEHTGSRPAAELSLVDRSGAQQTVNDAKGKDYSAAGAKGTAVSSVKITDPGTYRLTVSSTDSDFAVAVGKDPKGDADSVRNLGIGAGAIAALIGVILVILGMRRRGGPAPAPAWTASPPPATPYAAPAIPQSPQPAWPQAPPVSPPAPPPPPGWGAPPPPPQP
jgi:hypothetical protein